MPVRPGGYPSATDRAVASTGDNRKIAYAAGGGILLVLIAGFLLLKASGVLGAKKTQVPTTAVLNAPPAQPAPAPVLNVKPVEVPKVSAPVLQAPTTQGNPMPEDVIAYLRWLKQFEAARRNLKAKSDAQFMVILTNMTVTPLKELMKEPDEQKKNFSPLSKQDFDNMMQVEQQWNSVAGLFQRKTPPNPCAPLATAYNGMLGTVVAQQAKFQQVFSDIAKASSGEGGATPDLQKTLQELMGENNNKGMSRSADGTFQSANSALNELRSRYTSMPGDIDQSHFDISDQSQVTVPTAPTTLGM